MFLVVDHYLPLLARKSQKLHMASVFRALEFDDDKSRITINPKQVDPPLAAIPRAPNSSAKTMTSGSTT